VAKGVLHRHFADFDAFLAELIVERAGRLAAMPIPDAGTASVADNLAEIVTARFTPLVVAEVALVVTRDGLRQRLGELGAPRFALLGAVHAALAAYLGDEQALGRVAPTAEISTLAHLLVGSAHVSFTDADHAPVDRAVLRRLAATVLDGAA
jgi:AcrR family transcriptional regulator